MGDMLRSEQMTLCQIFIPSEAAYFVISELGEIGIVQFRDVILSISLSIVLTKLIHS
jgi:V-type H+-transporting ATPase subunit a